MPVYLSNLKPSPEDSRDYSFVSANSAPLPIAVDLRVPNEEIEDQDRLGSCTAHASTSNLELICLKNGVPRDLSRLFVYYNTRAMENRLGQEGAFLRDVFKTLNKDGIPLETTWPYDESQEDVKPSQAAYDEALPHRIGAYESVPLYPDDWQASVESIKRALADGYPVVIAMKVYEWIFHVKGPMTGHAILHGTTDYVGNHALLIVGYDPRYNGGSFIIQNSWGTNWGENGYFALSYASVSDIMEAWVIRDFDTFGIKYDPIQTRIAQLYISLFGRAPEFDGMKYWYAAANMGDSISKIAQDMYLCEPARKFYPTGMSNVDIVTSIYTNVLGRHPDPEGLAYWVNHLDNDGWTVGQLVVAIMEAVYEYKGDLPEALVARNRLMNRVDVALYFAVTMANNDLVQAYTILDSVTDDPATAYAVKQKLKK